MPMLGIDSGGAGDGESRETGDGKLLHDNLL
jgi:hypothetical protein